MVKPKKQDSILTIGVFHPAGRMGITRDWGVLLSFGFTPITIVSGIVLREDEIIPVEATTLGKEIDFFGDPNKINTVKIGLLATRENIETVATYFEDYKHHVNHLIVDSFIEAPDETPFLSNTAISLMKMRLLSLADVLVAYLSEAERLSGLPVKDITQMKEAAEAIRIYGPKYVLVRADHTVEGEWVDILYDGKEHQLLFTKRTPPKDLRKIRDLFTSSLSAYLARGREPREAIELAKEFEITKTLTPSPQAHRTATEPA